jgi:hypothetical protein
MNTTKQNSPHYVENAKFINDEQTVEKTIWPRRLSRYTKTENWKQRKKTLNDCITNEDLVLCVNNGKIYSGTRNSVVFVDDLDGVALYVIASSELKTNSGNTIILNKTPSQKDFKFKAVSIWAYVYDSDTALSESKWSEAKLDVIRKLYKDS